MSASSWSTRPPIQNPQQIALHTYFYKTHQLDNQQVNDLGGDQQNIKQKADDGEAEMKQKGRKMMEGCRGIIKHRSMDDRQEVVGSDEGRMTASLIQ